MRRDDLCHAVRERLVRLPSPYDSHYGVVPPAPPENALDVSTLAARYEAATAAKAKVETLAAEVQDPYLISRVLVRQEAVASSSIEGTNSTLDELLSVEETEDGAASTAAKQVRDYALALDALVPAALHQGPAIFDDQLVQQLHQHVMRDAPDYPDPPGQLRKRVVWIGGGRDIAYSLYNPPPPDNVPACLRHTLEYMRAEGMQVMTQGLLTRMAVAHAHFESVHPFRDGNGRVGRLLLPLMMAAEGRVPLYLSPYIEAHKPAYYEALKAAQQRLEWPVMVGFLADAVVGTVDELMGTRAALVALQDLWRRRRNYRSGSAALRALAVLPHYPVLTVRRLSELLKVSFKGAGQAMEQLAEAGVVVERTGYARNRVFVAAEALSVINRPFGSVPVLPER